MQINIIILEPRKSNNSEYGFFWYWPSWSLNPTNPGPLNNPDEANVNAVIWYHIE